MVLTSIALHVGLLLVISLTDVEGKAAVTKAYVGNSETVQCPLRSDSCSGIQWKKFNDSAALPLTSNNQQNGCDLIIKNVGQTDALRYQCTISGSSADVYLFVIEPQPSCTATAPSINGLVAEDDFIEYKCEATVYGIGKPQVKWFRKDGKLAEGQSRNNSQDYHIHGTLSTVAKAPKVQTLVCYASFSGQQAEVPVCETKEFKILYSVRNVLTRPLLYVGPGEELTCSADANPPASFYWGIKEDNATKWEFLAEGEKVVAELKNGTSSAKYKCQAVNVVRGVWHVKDSQEVSLTKHGKAIRIAIGVSVSVVVLLVIIAGVVICKKCLQCGN